MKKLILLIFLLNCAVVFAQKVHYSFIPKDFHFVSEADMKQKSQQVKVDMNNMSFYTVKGDKLDQMKAITQMQTDDAGSDIFLNESNSKMIVVMRPKTAAEKKSEEAEAESKAKAFVTKPSPAFKLNFMNGDHLSFEPASNDKLYVINFWFIACKPCLMEMPGLNRVVKKYKNKEVTFIAVTFDSKAQVEKFLKTNTFDYQHAVSAFDAVGKFGVKSFPTNLIIDRKGNIIFKEEGLGPGMSERLDKAIAKNLK